MIWGLENGLAAQVAYVEVVPFIATGGSGQGVVDGLDDLRVLGVNLGAEAVDDLAVFADEELGEVPLDLTGEILVGLLGGEEVVQGRDVVALDGDLGVEVEFHVLLGAEFLDFGVATGFLAAEIVRGEGEDGEALFLVLL